MTIAKLGRFKFSVEVAKQFDEELTNGKLAASSGGAVGGSGQGANKKLADNSNKKKISRKEKTETEAGAGAEPTSSPIKRKESTKLPSIHVTNFNAQKNSSNHTTTTTATGGGGANPEHSPGTASTSDLPTGPAFKAPPSVIVSKKRKDKLNISCVVD